MTSLSSIAIKRICSDMKDLARDPLEKEGIYCYYNESNMSDARIMMIGPEDTPYENGFYFFQFTFPNNYPFEPPKVKYMTQDGNVRFNPNLYTCGKVCLSLINTWDGPKWTSCQTIRSVLISLRGLVLGVKYPLQNEPGFESSTDTRATSYNDVISHENYRVAVVKMINNPPAGFQIFREQMIDYLKQKYPWYNTRLTQLAKFDNTKVKCNVYGMGVVRNFSKCLGDIKDILLNAGYSFPQAVKTKSILVTEDDYSSDEDDPETIRKKALLKKQNEIDEAKALLLKKQKELEDVKKTKELEKAKKLEENKLTGAKDDDGSDDKTKEKSVRKAPNEHAKNYEEGYEMTSIIDNKVYIVKKVGKEEGKQYKRWVMKK
jgi:ubiquitin-protein ligase